MDMICQRVLNQGFLKVERYHSLCQRQVKAQLPRSVSLSTASNCRIHMDIDCTNVSEDWVGVNASLQFTDRGSLALLWAVMVLQGAREDFKN